MTHRRQRPFSRATSAALIELVGAVLELQGFRLMPPRAPAIVNGRLRLGATWKHSTTDETRTVRVTVSRPRRPA